MTIRAPQPTVGMEMIRAAFAEKDASIGIGEAYNLYARLMGYKNWAHFKKENKNVNVEGATYADAFQHELKDWKSWPIWVLTEDPETGDIQVLPTGTSPKLELELLMNWSA